MINPIDLRHKKFKKALRGYDIESVHAFLDSLADELKNIILEKEAYKQELGEANAKLQQYQEMEEILRRTLMQAEESSKKTIENAEKQAQIIINEAEQKAKAIIEEAEKERRRLELKIQELIFQEQQLLEHLKMFLSSQLTQINQYLQNENKFTLTTPHKTFSPEEEKKIRKTAEEQKKTTTVSYEIPIKNTEKIIEKTSFFETALKKESEEKKIAEEISKEL